MHKYVHRAAILAVLVVACAATALTTGVVTHSTADASAAGPCQLGNKDGQIKHVIYLQFDNTHYRRDVANVPSDLEQMPHLLDFLKSEIGASNTVNNRDFAGRTENRDGSGAGASSEGAAEREICSSCRH